MRTISCAREKSKLPRWAATGSRVDMPRLLNAWKKGHLKLDHLITSHIKLDEINEGYAKLKEGNVLRQLVDFGVAT
jgi:Zn-dependent alcohol dehydrogenase